MNEFQNKKLIIFDLDGTLIDSVPDLARTVNFILISLGREEFKEDEIRQWVGNGAQVLIKRALSGNAQIDESKFSEDDVEKGLEIFFDYYSKNCAVKTTLYPHVKETLESLHSKGYILSVATNKPFDFIEPILKALEINSLFTYNIGGDSLEVKKPDPQPLLHICEKLGVTVENTLMVGDSKNDILAANNAKMDSVGLTYGYNYNEDISLNNPTVVTDNFGDLDKLL